MTKNVIKLNNSHIEDLCPLFENQQYMGVSLENKNFFGKEKLPEFYDHFCNSYLGACQTYHAYGVWDDEKNKLQCVMSFYESVDEAAWYGTLVRSLGEDFKSLHMCLDTLIKYNEENGRLKFYIMVPERYNNIYRRFLMSPWAKERYDSVDEFYVKAKEQCKYTSPWHFLYSRLLNPTDTVVKCLYLKREYRTELINGGKFV